MAFVENLYEKYLQREGDVEGIKYWQGGLDSGKTEQEIEKEFTSSIAFINEQDAINAKAETDRVNAATAATALANKQQQQQQADTANAAALNNVTKAVSVDKVYQSTPVAGVSSTYTASNYKPTTLSEQMNVLLSENSDYLKLARTQADQQMNSRGLLNTSIAQGASQAAAIDRVMPIAEADANALNQSARDNTTYDNAATIANTNMRNEFALAQKQALDSASSNYADARNNAEQQNANNGIAVVLQNSINEMNAYGNEISRQVKLDELSYNIFKAALDSGIYADTSVYDPETGEMTQNNSVQDQARVDGWWQNIAAIIPDAGRPVIEKAIEAASTGIY